MELKQTNILDLNDYCLGQILRYLKVDSHVRFAETCTRFREVFHEWFLVLYPEYELKLCDDSDNDITKSQLKLLCKVKNSIRRLLVTEENHITADRVWKLCKLIEGMDNLECIAISTDFGFEPIERILTAAEVLPKLKSISLDSLNFKDIYIPRSLINLKCLERISIETQITSNSLVEICKSNGKLRVLLLRYVKGKLEDIVPYCENLEEISFPVYASHKSYVAVAKLPKIRKVKILKFVSSKGKQTCKQMFAAFASKGEENKLESLIFDPILNFEETSNLILLPQLKELWCTLEDAKCIDLLKNLTELKSLCIRIDGTGTTECLNVLKSCRKLQRLCIYSNLQIDFVPKAMAVLKSVRNPDTQKPLQLYLTGLLGLNKVEKENLVDRAYCILNDEKNLCHFPWKIPN